MQNDQALLRTQRIIEHLGDLWRYPQEPSPDELKRITEFVVSLQEPYRKIGFEKIAEHTISNMSLHILALMATFQEKAEQEGISPENRKEALDYIQPAAFEILGELSKNVSVRSLDDLAALTNITVSLQTLSQNDSAEAAQSWLYELPTMYYRQLTQEGLVAIIHDREEKSADVNWLSFSSASGVILSGAGLTQVAISPEKDLPIRIPVCFETDKNAA